MKVFPKFLVTTIFLLLAQPSIAEGDTYISECGFYSNSDNETLVITGDLVAQSFPCITISHRNVELNCEGHMIQGPGVGDYTGIFIEDTADGVLVNDCKLSNWFIGIAVEGDNGIIQNNTITYSAAGLVLSGAIGNQILTNKAGYCHIAGIAVLDSHLNLFRDNGFFLNQEPVTSEPYPSGMVLIDSNNNDLIDNRIGNNITGLYLLGSHENAVIDNVSKGNLQAGVRLEDSSDNLIADVVSAKNYIGIEERGESLNNVYFDNVCRDNDFMDSNVEGACN